jgi:hypothetical protein
LLNEVSFVADLMTISDRIRKLFGDMSVMNGTLNIYLQVWHWLHLELGLTPYKGDCYWKLKRSCRASCISTLWNTFNIYLTGKEWQSTKSAEYTFFPRT